MTQGIIAHEELNFMRQNVSSINTKLTQIELLSLFHMPEFLKMALKSINLKVTSSQVRNYLPWTEATVKCFLRVRIKGIGYLRGQDKGDRSPKNVCQS